MDMEAAAQLPCMPIFLLQSSALGSGLIEFFLGNGVLVSGVTENAVLPLHPFAIAGFTGMLANALALLPLGRKYLYACMNLYRLPFAAVVVVVLKLRCTLNRN